MKLDAATLGDGGNTGGEQLASPERTISTGVGALSSDAKTSDDRPPRGNSCRGLLGARPKKLPITERRAFRSPIRSLRAT